MSFRQLRSTDSGGGDDFDPWKMDDGTGYSPSRFYVGSRDEKTGYCENIRVKIPASVVSELGALVASRKIPAYRTSSDVVRDAVFHRLRWLGEHVNDPRLQQYTNLQILNAELDRHLTELAELAENYDKHEALLSRALLHEDWELMDLLLNETEDRASALRDPYRGSLLRLVEKYRADVKRRQR